MTREDDSNGNLPDSELRAQVRRVLAGRWGKSEAITSEEISNRLGGVDHLDSTPRTREAIRDLVVVEGMPIGACGDGYYLIETREELEECLSGLESRAMKILDRRAAINAAVRRHAEQVDEEYPRQVSADQSTLEGLYGD
jgi:hypothetical protein